MITGCGTVQTLPQRKYAPAGWRVSVPANRNALKTLAELEGGALGKLPTCGSWMFVQKMACIQGLLRLTVTKPQAMASSRGSRPR